MKIAQPYKPRPIRFLELYQHNTWTVKIYSISSKKEYATNEDVLLAKKSLNEWLLKSNAYNFETYNLATLIIHEYDEGCFAIINWWIDENMLQNFVYLKKNNERQFNLFSENGINTCVWEMAIWWHERNAWIKHVLSNYENPDVGGYLNNRLSINI